MQLTREFYSQTAALPKGEIVGLQSQMRRAAVSIPSGSLYELETQIQLCEDLNFIQPIAAKNLFELCSEVARMINGLLKTLKPKDAKQAANQLTC